jgi:hypothetical protein
MREDGSVDWKVSSLWFRRSDVEYDKNRAAYLSASVKFSEYLSCRGSCRQQGVARPSRAARWTWSWFSAACLLVPYWVTCHWGSVASVAETAACEELSPSTTLRLTSCPRLGVASTLSCCQGFKPKYSRFESGGALNKGSSLTFLRMICVVSLTTLLRIQRFSTLYEKWYYVHCERWMVMGIGYKAQFVVCFRAYWRHLRYNIMRSQQPIRCA